MNKTKALCIAAFAVLCAFMFMFLNTFTISDENEDNVMCWEQLSISAPDGSVTTHNPLDISAPKQGYVYKFSGHFDTLELGEVLSLSTINSAVTLKLNGDVVYDGQFVELPDSLSDSSAYICLPELENGAFVELEYRMLDGNAYVFPPHLSVRNMTDDMMSDIAFGNSHSMPAAIYGMVFLIICGLFLLGIAFGSPDFTLLFPAAAALGLSMTTIAQGFGYGFLNETAASLLAWDGILFIIPLTLIAYIFFNRKRSFPKYFGLINAVTLPTLAIMYVISLLCNGNFSYSVNAAIDTFVHGLYYANAMNMINAYLVFSSALIALGSMFLNFSQLRSEAQLLRLRSDMLTSNFHSMERSVKQTAAIRHELKHNITALYLLFQNGDTEQLGKLLSTLYDDQSSLVQMQFCDNLAINTILRNYANICAENNIQFKAQALVEADLGIDEQDLCGLLMNMLDNAVEAVSALSNPKERFINLRTEQKQGFLAISCTNSYNGLVLKDGEKISSSKQNKDFHGFGIKYMNSIAKKYNSILDVSYSEKEFTVQTALKIKNHK